MSTLVHTQATADLLEFAPTPEETAALQIDVFIRPSKLVDALGKPAAVYGTFLGLSDTTVGGKPAKLVRVASPRNPRYVVAFLASSAMLREYTESRIGKRVMMQFSGEVQAGEKRVNTYLFGWEP